MGLFQRKPDPISERTKALNAQIASLEAQIKKLDGKVQESAHQPRLRSTALPKGQAPIPQKKNSAALREPIFETVDPKRLQPPPEEEQTLHHYNDLGVRKYDLAGLWRRLRRQFRGPPASNPRLVTYLVAGSIKGLRPLRYEKRVARNRFIALLLILICLVWGIISFFFRTR